MQGLKKVFGLSLITSVIFLIMGCFLFFKTEGTINLIASIIGVIMLINGGISIIKYFKDNSNVDLVYGIIAIIAGFVLTLNPSAVASILPFVLGIYFTVSGIIKLKYALDIKSYQKTNPIFMIIISVLTVVCGILFIIDPFGGALAITKTVGLFMIIYSVLDIINYFILRHDLKIIGSIFK